MNDDWPLIYASFQTQYGIRLSQSLNGMSWREFAYLLAGLDGKTPLGRIVSIRSEKDPEVIKEFSASEKAVRNEYLRKRANNMPQAKVDEAINNFKNVFLGMVKNEEA